nr:tyrosine-type recombinase/integrase [Pseudonocardia acidicola]
MRGGGPFGLRVVRDQQLRGDLRRLGGATRVGNFSEQLWGDSPERRQQVGTQLDAANVRRAFRRIATAAKLPAKDWTPRELRHSFVSLLSDGGMPIEQISRLVGHSGTSVTELIYRKQIRPVVDNGATAMDRIFPAAGT